MGWHQRFGVLSVRMRLRTDRVGEGVVARTFEEMRALSLRESWEHVVYTVH